MKAIIENTVFLSELKEGEKFQVPSMALPSGYKRTYIYTQQTRVKTLIFKSVDGNGELKLPEIMQFKLIVEKVA
jgi:hypothetical protein